MILETMPIGAPLLRERTDKGDLQIEIAENERGESMKKYAKFAGILLALVMLVALIPMTALADNQTYPPDTNPPTDNVSVVVIKRAYGLDNAKEYTFNFEYYQVEDPTVNNWEIKPIENGVKGEFPITVAWNGQDGYHSGSYTIKGLPRNKFVAIEEIAPVIPEGYRLVFTSGIAVSDASGQEGDKIIHNNYEKRNDCDVVISKAVEGNNANVNDEFEFEVTFHLNDDIVVPNPSQPPIAYSANAAASVRAPGAGNDKGIYKRFANGSTHEFGPNDLTYDGKEATLRFTLKHGESLSIINLAAKNRPIKVKELDSKGYLTTVNGITGTQWEMDKPVADTIRVNFINTKESLPLSESLSVEKRWSDGNEKHMRESVTVQLYRNGEPYSLNMFGRVVDDGRAELSAANRWQHTWRGLDTGYKWTVAELNVPKGYVSTVNYYGGNAIITNTAVSAGLPQTGDAQTPFIGAGLVLAAIAMAIVAASRKRD